MTSLDDIFTIDWDFSEIQDYNLRNLDSFMKKLQIHNKKLDDSSIMGCANNCQLTAMSVINYLKTGKEIMPRDLLNQDDCIFDNFSNILGSHNKKSYKNLNDYLSVNHPMEVHTGGHVYCIINNKVYDGTRFPSLPYIYNIKDYLKDLSLQDKFHSFSPDFHEFNEVQFQKYNKVKYRKPVDWYKQASSEFPIDVVKSGGPFLTYCPVDSVNLLEEYKKRGAKISNEVKYDPNKGGKYMDVELIFTPDEVSKILKYYN